jgi:predicted permease
MTFRDLLLRLRALAAPRRVERELDEELAFHIEREAREQIAAGASPRDARARALARFGPVPLAADQCRDARGTRFFDDLVRDIFYACRTFRRGPLAAVTIVATVAIGLGLVTAVFAFYDAVFLHIDEVRSPGELAAVQVQRRSDAGADEDVAFTLADYDAMRREVSVFTDIFGMAGMFTRVDGRSARAAPVTGNFFEVLGARAALGRVLLPGDDERLGGSTVIVLSDVGWRKLFQRDRAVIGRHAAINGAPYEVVGVMPAGFRGIEELVPDYWVPLSQAGRLLGYRVGWEDEVGLHLVGRLKAGISPRAATDALQAWAVGRSALTRPGRPVRVSVALPEGLLEINAVNGLIIFSPLFVAFGLILLIGCANVANLLLARGVSRQRELGIRLSLGASRRRVIRQLLTESLILALAAAACGLVVAQVFLNAALDAAITTLPPEIAHFVSLLNLPTPALDWRVVVFLMAGATAATMFFGLAPALQATRLELVRTMRGEVARDARPGRARRILITVQVGASALLVICAAVLLRGVFAAATREPGIRTSDTLRVSIETSRGAARCSSRWRPIPWWQLWPPRRSRRAASSRRPCPPVRQPAAHRSG